MCQLTVATDKTKTQSIATRQIALPRRIVVPPPHLPRLRAPQVMTRALVVPMTETAMTVALAPSIPFATQALTILTATALGLLQAAASM